MPDEPPLAGNESRGNGVMAASPTAVGRPSGDQSDALTSNQPQPAACPGLLHSHLNERTVRNVRIIARVLDDPGFRPALTGILPGECKANRLPARQGNLYAVGELAALQRFGSRLCRSSGAGTGGPAATQCRARLRVCFSAEVRLTALVGDP